MKTIAWWVLERFAACIWVAIFFTVALWDALRNGFSKEEDYYD